MNNYGVRTTMDEKASFPYEEYPIMDSIGTFRVTLMDKVWGNYMNIICAFVTDEGKKFHISILRRRNDELYGPSKSSVDFATAPIGSKWICTFVKRKNFVNMSDAVPCD